MSGSPALDEDRRRRLAEYVDRNGEAVLAYARILTDDADEADDLVQAAWLRVLESLPTLREDVAFAAWVKKIVRSCFIDGVRTREREARSVRDYYVIAPWADQPTNGVAIQDLEDEVVSCVMRLPPKQRLVASMRLLRGRSIADTARHLGRSPGTIKAMQHQALEKLREEAARLRVMKEACHDPLPDELPPAIGEWIPEIPSDVASGGQELTWYQIGPGSPRRGESGTVPHGTAESASSSMPD